MSGLRATPNERRTARLIAAALFLLLLLQIAQNTIFNGVIFDALGRAAFHRLNVAVFAAIILVAIARAAWRHRLRRFRSVWMVTLAYGAVVVASTALNVPDVTETRLLQAVLVPLTILALGVCLPAIFDLDDYQAVFRRVIVVFALSALASLWLVWTQQEFLFGLRLQVPRDGRGGELHATGLYTQRNAIGSFLQYIPALIVYLMSRRRAAPRPPAGARLWSAAYICTLPLVAVHLLLTFSRSSQLVALVSLVPLLGTPRVRAQVLHLGVAAILVAVVVLGLLAVPEFQRYVGLGGSLEGRDLIWQGVLRQGLERPVLGFGLLNLEFRAFTRTFNPHSAYLAQFAYYGIAGLTLFLALLVAFGRLVLQNLRAASQKVSWPIVFLLAAVLVQGVLEYIITFPVFFANSMFWICLGLAARDEGRHEEPPAGRDRD